MSLVCLVSGGLDSTVMTKLAVESGTKAFPLFINYGQLSAAKERAACLKVFSRLKLPKPVVADISGYGRLISSGLTDRDCDVFMDAFLPGRNLMFLLLGSAYAYQVSANAVAIGLLSEDTSIFPDQTARFVSEAQKLISRALGKSIAILTPLAQMTKADLVSVARGWRLRGTYSCHQGSTKPCGFCVACREYQGLEG